MSPKYYKGYRVGSLEKGILKIILNIKDNELPNKYNESFSDIIRTARQKFEYPKTLKRMVRKGLIKFVDRGGELKVIITDKGRKMARDLILDDFNQFERPEDWDGKWRIVVFDIPERKRKLRNIIRFHLKKIGFLQIQGSVWVYPYPCEEIVTLIKTNFNFDNEVVYLTTESFEKDIKFKKVFKL
jgi:virulence-associated protein VapD/predicted transcriptional regulator